MAAFQTTREHRRFTEFADTVRAHRYIGLCWGPPGVGKTLSARHYAGTDDWEQWQTIFEDDFGPVPPRVLEAHTAFFTPSVAATIRESTAAYPPPANESPSPSITTSTASSTLTSIPSPAPVGAPNCS
jgi:hypothetical protein